MSAASSEPMDQIDEDQDVDLAPYDALLLLTSSESVEPPDVSFRTPYDQLDNYLAAARTAYLTAGSSSIMELNATEHDEGASSKVPRTPEMPSTKRTLTLQRQASAMNHPGRDGQNDISALKSEIESLKAELALAKQRVSYERHQRVMHADKYKLLSGRLKQTAAMKEENQAQRDQLRSQENEIRQLIASLAEQRQQNYAQRQEFANKESQLTSRLQTIQRENETVRSSLVASKRTVDDLLLENRRLTKELGGFVQRLLDKEAAYKNLQEQYNTELPSSKQTIHHLNKELFVAGSVNRRLREYAKAAKSNDEEIEAMRERLRCLEESSKQECSNYRKLFRKEKHKADGALQRVQGLESMLRKHQSQIAESKRLLDATGEMHQEQITACETKFRALLAVCERQEAHILELYDKLETKQIEAQKRDERGHVSLDINYPFGQNHSSKGLENDAYVSIVGMTIPGKPDINPEARSYDSCHSVGHQSGTGMFETAALSTSVASACSCRSSDLYLHYLFNSDFSTTSTQQVDEIMENETQTINGDSY